MLGAILLSLMAAPVQDDPLAALVEVLKVADDDAFRLDVLRGIRDGLKGRPSVKMPPGWPEVREKLAKSGTEEVRQLAQQISITFGDAGALGALRAQLADPKAAPETRKTALDALLGARDPELPAVLEKLLGEAGLRGPALRALASYERPGVPALILGVYATLDVAEKRDAINTLVSRKTYAAALVQAVQEKKVPRTDLTAASIRSLRDLGDPAIEKWIAAEWGMARSSP
jgi:hypothetical protein